MIEIYFCAEKINHGVSQNVAPLCSGSLCVAEVLGRFRDVHHGPDYGKTCTLIAP